MALCKDLLLSLSVLTPTALANFRPDIKSNVEIAELNPDQIIPKGAREIPLGFSPAKEFIMTIECKEKARSFSFAPDGKFVGCCLPGQHLSGSKKTGYSCCGAGHQHCGNERVGYACCLEGHQWDGRKCVEGSGGHHDEHGGNPREPHGGSYGNPHEGPRGNPYGGSHGEPHGGPHGRPHGGPHGGPPHGQHGDHGDHHPGGPKDHGNCNGDCGEHHPHPPHHQPQYCANGKYLVDGKCVCNPGTIENCHGECVQENCTSGITTGQCYQIIFPNGKKLGFESVHRYYGPGDESRNQKAGRFTFCTTEQCPAGVNIDPGDGFRIRDIHGDPNTGAMANAWLNNLANGGHIGKTLNWAEAGVFTITKWPCGKYCLGGLDAGVGPTCPADVVGSTFTPLDPEQCQEVELIQVPCKIRDKKNNCTWKSGKDQCCDGKVDCSKKTDCHREEKHHRPTPYGDQQVL